MTKVWKKEFIKEYQELCTKHNVHVDSCDCCDSCCGLWLAHGDDIDLNEELEI